MGNPARITNEGTQGLLYAPSRQMAAEPKPAKEAAVCAEELTPDRVAALYWEAFSSSFPGVDFNPVNFRFHDPGWDSIAQMKLICALEEAFNITIKGRDTMKINSFSAGFEFVRRKLAKAGKGREAGARG